ncbi:PAS domain-containing protein [Aestuariispira insulae]|uniref:PAS domain-containing protein n=1 Tax=Aestuariispira insulae TaxID=1461337 RepID=A0A3D9HPE8_9PROT|nr:PAS domain-containing protein [Aestuariispira insulae]RED51285.1 PAS domain-containing protein [Aestuariispira insulae]
MSDGLPNPLSDLIGEETARIRDFPDAIKDEGLRQLALSWVDRFLIGGGIPSSHALDPVVFPKALNCVWYLEFDDQVGEYRFRLVGNRIAEAMGQYPRGQLLSDVYSGDDYSFIRDFLHESLTMPAMLYAAGSFELASTEAAEFERLCLPVSASEGKVDRVIGGTVFHAPTAGAQFLLTQELQTYLKVNLSGYAISGWY